MKHLESNLRLFFCLKHIFTKLFVGASFDQLCFNAYLRTAVLDLSEQVKAMTDRDCWLTWEKAHPHQCQTNSG